MCINCTEFVWSGFCSRGIQGWVLPEAARSFTHVQGNQCQPALGWTHHCSRLSPSGMVRVPLGQQILKEGQKQADNFSQQREEWEHVRNSFSEEGGGEMRPRWSRFAGRTCGRDLGWSRRVVWEFVLLCCWGEEKENSGVKSNLGKKGEVGGKWLSFYFPLPYSALISRKSS